MLKRIKEFFANDMLIKKEKYDNDEYNKWIGEQQRLADIIDTEVIEEGVEEYYESKESEEA